MPAFATEYALLVLIACAVAAGVVGAVVRTWSIHQRLYSLEDRQLVLEATLQREVKIRAAAASVESRKRDIFAPAPESKIEKPIDEPFWVRAARMLPRSVAHEK